MSLIIDKLKNADECAIWSQVVQSLRKKYPKFNPKHYGSNNKKFLDFFKNDEKFSFKKDKCDIFIKNK